VNSGNRARSTLKVAGGLAGALALGVFLGVVAVDAGAVADLEAQVSTSKGDLQRQEEASKSERQRHETAIAVAEGATADAQGIATAAEDSLATAQAGLARRAAALDKRTTAVAGAERAVLKREKAVSVTEDEIDASMIEPGTYLVPSEVEAGRYRTVDDISDCYMSQDKGSNIVNNLAEEAGRPVFTVTSAPGTTFTIQPECGAVQKID